LEKKNYYLDNIMHGDQIHYLPDGTMKIDCYSHGILLEE
jgi:hypothetical protein